MAFDQHKKLVTAKREFLKALDQMVPVMGNEALNHFKDSFPNQGFTNESTEKWKPRKRPDRKRPGRAILIDTGRLRRSLRYSRSRKYEVVIKSNKPYAKIQNEGGEISVSSRKGSGTINTYVRGNDGFVDGKFKRGRKRKLQLLGAAYETGAYTIKIPKRQFVGYSGKLNRRLIEKFDKRIKTIFGQ